MSLKGWNQMDVQRLTTLARETLSVAIRQTSAAGNPTVEPIHLLSALLAQPEGTTIGLLEAAGADLDASTPPHRGAARPAAEGEWRQRAGAEPVARRPPTC